MCRCDDIKGRCTNSIKVYSQISKYLSFFRIRKNKAVDSLIFGFNYTRGGGGKRRRKNVLEIKNNRNSRNGRNSSSSASHSSIYTSVQHR